MSLSERCQTLRGQIDMRNALKLAHKNAEALRERADELRSIKMQVVSELEKFAVLKRQGFGTLKLPAPVVAVGLLREIIDKLKENSDEIGRDYGQLKRSTEAFRKNIESAVEKTLATVKRDLPSIDEGFLKQVETIPAYANQVVRIREQRDRLLGGTNIHQMAAAELDQFLKRRDSLRALVDQLLPTEFPKEVLDFFKAARHEGAPLDKFTESVRAWLEKRNQLKNVRVIVKS